MQTPKRAHAHNPRVVASERGELNENQRSVEYLYAICVQQMCDIFNDDGHLPSFNHDLIEFSIKLIGLALNLFHVLYAS